jgi:site-specific DNA-methyltransferase (adenine-specific)
MSNRHDWGTPADLYKMLDDKFHFTVDVCAQSHNAKHSRYFTPEQDGLKQNWGGEVAFCNPPYGREIGKWVKKASESMGTVVMLIPARTDTKWFHDYIYTNESAQVFFLRGRVKFDGQKQGAPFPSMVVVFNSEHITNLNNCIEY